ncbi:MAG: hypothetical protein WC222_10865 [Parachlamydiales bacterium]|jgi:hypothetical protein
MTIPAIGKSIIDQSVLLLNRPFVKDSVKKIAGSFTFAFGLLELYDIYQILKGRPVVSEVSPTAPRWVQISHKVIIVSAKVSLVLSAGVSRPGVYLISTLAGSVFSTEQLTRYFGTNTIFAVNPWHPRHVASIAAVILAAPAFVQSVYKGFLWLSHSVQQPSDTASNGWMDDIKVRTMSLFNIIFSRPVLHMGNAALLRPV